MHMRQSYYLEVRNDCLRVAQYVSFSVRDHNDQASHIFCYTLAFITCPPYLNNLHVLLLIEKYPSDHLKSLNEEL